MRKRKPQRSKNKALRKQKNKIKEEARLARKTALQKEDVLFSEPSILPQKEVVAQSQPGSEWIDDSLLIEENSLLSYNRYRMYSIRNAKEIIGNFGVYRNGCFNYAIRADNVSEKEFLTLVQQYIRDILKLPPFLNPRLYHPKNA